MLRRKTVVFAIFVTVMLLAATSLLSAAAFTNVIVYGDSLSDNGNVYALMGEPPSLLDEPLLQRPGDSGATDHRPGAEPEPPLRFRFWRSHNRPGGSP